MKFYFAIIVLLVNHSVTSPVNEVNDVVVIEGKTFCHYCPCHTAMEMDVTRSIQDFNRVADSI